LTGGVKFSRQEELVNYLLAIEIQKLVIGKVENS